MLDYVGDTIVRLPVTLIRNGDPLVPNVGTVTYSIFDHSGGAVAGQQDIPVTTTATTFRLTLEIPASVNTIGADKRFERRTVVLSFEAQGAAGTQTTVYRLTPRLNHSVTAAQVRSFLGVADHELLDADIDLAIAYFMVEAQIGQTTLEAALTSGTTNELAANDIIKMTAVLDVLPSLKQRLAQEEQNGVKMFARASIKNFDELRADAERRLNVALETLIIGDGTDLVLVVVTQDVDPITAGG